MDLGLEGKVALVTGASRGIGHSIARTLIAEGCRLSICGRDPDSLERAAIDLRAVKDLGTGGEVLAMPADVLDADQAANFVARCAAELGGIDILINNVGGSAGGGLMQASDDDWRNSFELSLFQAVRLMRLCVPHMRQRGGGAIINIASISGMHPQLGGVAQYGAAKAALIFAAERFALELAPDNIRVNTISPGSVMAPDGFWDKIRQKQPATFEAYTRTSFPMGRLGDPDDIAPVVAFVASPRGHWINGRNIPVDGLQQPTGWDRSGA